MQQGISLRVMCPQTVLTMLLSEYLHVLHLACSYQRYDFVVVLASNRYMRLLPGLQLALACRWLPQQFFQEGSTLVRGALEMLLEPTWRKRSRLHEVILRFNQKLPRFPQFLSYFTLHLRLYRIHPIYKGILILLSLTDGLQRMSLLFLQTTHQFRDNFFAQEEIAASCGSKQVLIECMPWFMEIFIQFVSILILDLLGDDLANQSLLSHQIKPLRRCLSLFADNPKQFFPEGIFPKSHSLLQEIDALIELLALSLRPNRPDLLCLRMPMHADQPSLVPYVPHRYAAIGETIHEEKRVVQGCPRCAIAGRAARRDQPSIHHRGASLSAHLIQKIE